MSALARHGHLDAAEAALAPIVARVVEDGGYWEWRGRDGSAQGSEKYKGAAGVVGVALKDIAEARARARARAAARGGAGRAPM